MTTDASPTEAEVQAHTEATEAEVQAAEALKTAVKEGKTDLPLLAGYRGFVAPVAQNTKFLAKRGELIQLRDQNSPTGMRDASRDGGGGDVWVRFIQGTFISNNPDAIAWCEAHPEICRDARDPMTSTWYMMRESQTPLKNRPASLAPEVNVDAALGGDLSKLGGENRAVSSTRAFTEQANERQKQPAEA